MENIQLEELVNKYPNDSDLGSALRKFMLVRNNHIADEYTLDSVDLNFGRILDPDRKKLIQIRSNLDFYKKLKKKIDNMLDATLELEDYDSEIYNKIDSTERKLDDLKMNMNLSDDEWAEDES